MVEFTLPKNSVLKKGKTFKAPADVKNSRRFEIYRWNPDTGENPRIDTFDGKRIGLLWNSKPNGNHYLNRVAELVSQRFPSAKVTKFYETHPVETANPDKKSDAAIALMAQNADVVIAAQGD